MKGKTEPRKPERTVSVTLRSAPLLSSPTMASPQRPIVFMDINIGETPAGRLKMELFSDVVPKYVSPAGSLRTVTVHPPPY